MIAPRHPSLLLLCAAACACNAITNIGDFSVESDGASPDTSSDSDSSVSDSVAGDVFDAGRPIEIIATDQAQPGAIAVDDQYVYWLNYGRQGRIDEGALLNCAMDAKCGAAPNALVIGRGPGGAILLDSTNVTFTTLNKGAPSTGTIQRCPAKSPTCSPNMVRDGEDGPIGLARSGDDLLWTILAGTVRRCSTAVACSDAADFYPRTTPLVPIVTDGTQVFFAETVAGIGGRILKCLLVSCSSATVVAPGQRRVFNMIEGVGRVFWTELEPDGRVLSIRTDGSETTPVVIADLQNKPAGIARDLTDLYWANRGGGTLMHGKTDKGSGAPETLVSGLEQPNSVAVRGDWIYVTTIGADDKVAKGTVIRVHK